MNENPRVPRYRIALVRETGLNVEYPHTLRASDKAALVFRELARDADRELVMAATLDSKNRVIGVNIVHMGSLSTSVAAPRDIVKLAILQNAAAIIVGHNHPSGSPGPSREDMDLHARLEAAANVVGIRYLDNIIIGEDMYYSFNDGGERPYEGEHTRISVVG